MTYEIEINAAVFARSDDSEALVVELPGDAPVGCRVIGTMHFKNGACIARQQEETIAAVVLMAAASEPFAQIVAARLRSRPDYTAWRQRILATSSPIVMEN